MASGTAHFDRADHSLGRDHIEDDGSSRRDPNMAKARKTNEKGASTRVKAGDAFLMPLPDGRFGFCHVIYLPGKGDGPLLRGQIMVETSAWTGTEPPDLNDPRLREVHVNTHHNSGPNVWRVMVRGPAPESLRSCMPPACADAMGLRMSGGSGERCAWASDRRESDRQLT